MLFLPLFLCCMIRPKWCFIHRYAFDLLCTQSVTSKLLHEAVIMPNALLHGYKTILSCSFIFSLSFVDPISFFIHFSTGPLHICMYLNSASLSCKSVLTYNIRGDKFIKCPNRLWQLSWNCFHAGQAYVEKELTWSLWCFSEDAALFCYSLNALLRHLTWKSFCLGIVRIEEESQCRPSPGNRGLLMSIQHAVFLASISHHLLRLIWYKGNHNFDLLHYLLFLSHI